MPNWIPKLSDFALGSMSAVSEDWPGNPPLYEGSPSDVLLFYGGWHPDWLIGLAAVGAIATPGTIFRPPSLLQPSGRRQGWVCSHAYSLVILCPCQQNKPPAVITPLIAAVGLLPTTFAKSSPPMPRPGFALQPSPTTGLLKGICAGKRHRRNGFERLLPCCGYQGRRASFDFPKRAWRVPPAHSL
jgi:hypothetical protein